MEKNESLKGQKILVEHSSPNLFKPFHIGHVMNNSIGESVTRLHRMAGAEVTAISYPSDVSLGIGQAVWALLQEGVETIRDDSVDVSSKLKVLADAYVRGKQTYKDDESIHQVVRDITQQIYRQEEGEAWDAYQLGKQLSLNYFQEMTARLGSSFDGYVYESEAGRAGKEIVQTSTGSVFVESNGAVIYEGEQDGLHTPRIYKC